MKLDIQKFADGSITIETQLDTKSFDAQIEHLENELAEYEQLAEKYANAGRKLTEQEQEDYDKLQEKIEKTGNKLVDLYKKKQMLNSGGNFWGNAKEDLDGIVKKVAKWGLAIFSVRSAYMFVRQAVSTLSQQNKNLAKDIENIRYGLASALQPVIEKIVQWAYKLMQAINYIWYVMTGKNLFSNMKNDLNASNKSAKQLQKTMAGFDEMNVLSDSNGSALGGANIGTITEDLTATTLLSEKEKKVLEQIGKVLKELWTDVLQPLWDKVLKPIGEWLLENPEILLGFISAILAFNLVSKIAGLVTAIGSAGLIGALVALDAILINKIYKDIKNKLIPEIKETRKEIEKAIKLQDSVANKTKEVTQAILDNAKAENENTEATSKSIDVMLKTIKSNEILNEDYKQHLGLKEKLTGVYKLNTEAIKINNTQSEDYLNTLGELYKMGKLNEEQVKLYKQALESQINILIDDNKKLNQNSVEYKNNTDRIAELKAQLEKTKGNYNVNVLTQADKQPVDNLAKAVNDVEGTHTIKLKSDTSQADRGIGNWLKGLGKGLFSVLFPNLSFASTLAKFKLAKGGIINMPGRGVPVGGEAGREGVIPLTDSQQMALLGEAIGKYITINANITNTMNGRVISRELQKIQNESNFANNL